MKSYMSDEIKLLCERHPHILGSADVGFRDGWIDLIDVLCEQLQKQTDERGAPQVRATQIKEKFGTLRFYSSGCSREQEALIDMAEELSERTCEVCGARGKLRQFGWLQTLCDAHAEAFRPGE